MTSRLFKDFLMTVFNSVTIGREIKNHPNSCDVIYGRLPCEKSYKLLKSLRNFRLKNFCENPTWVDEGDAGDDLTSGTLVAMSRFWGCDTCSTSSRSSSPSSSPLLGRGCPQIWTWDVVFSSPLLTTRFAEKRIFQIFKISHNSFFY